MPKTTEVLTGTMGPALDLLASHDEDAVPADLELQEPAPVQLGPPSASSGSHGLLEADPATCHQGLVNGVRR
jgi:hypothetical protein